MLYIFNIIEQLFIATDHQTHITPPPKKAEQEYLALNST